MTISCECYEAEVKRVDNRPKNLRSVSWLFEVSAKPKAEVVTRKGYTIKSLFSSKTS